VNGQQSHLVVLSSHLARLAEASISTAFPAIAGSRPSSCKLVAREFAQNRGNAPSTKQRRKCDRF
jgi:hypothetical protein